MDVSKLFDVSGKTALVTGGTSGIGEMIAEGLVSAGARVWICARKGPDVEATVERLSRIGECHGFVADLAGDEGVAAAVEAMKPVGKLNILVNNAGATWIDKVDDFPRKGFEDVLNLNVTSVFMLTQAMLPFLRAAQQPGDPARVINITSINAFRPGGYVNYSYSASKAGAKMLTEHLGVALVEDNITVNGVGPGLFRSRLTEPLMDLDDPAVIARIAPPLGRIGTPPDIVGAVIYLASEAGAWLTGVTIPLAGGVGTIK